MTAANDATAYHYEISVLAGPCTDREAEAAVEAIADLPEVQRIGGAVGATRGPSESES